MATPLSSEILGKVLSFADVVARFMRHVDDTVSNVSATSMAREAMQHASDLRDMVAKQAEAEAPPEEVVPVEEPVTTPENTPHIPEADPTDTVADDLNRQEADSHA